MASTSSSTNGKEVQDEKKMYAIAFITNSRREKYKNIDNTLVDTQLIAETTLVDDEIDKVTWKVYLYHLHVHHKYVDNLKQQIWSQNDHAYIGTYELDGDKLLPTEAYTVIPVYVEILVDKKHQLAYAPDCMPITWHAVRDSSGKRVATRYAIKPNTLFAYIRETNGQNNKNITLHYQDDMATVFPPQPSSSGNKCIII